MPVQTATDNSACVTLTGSPFISAHVVADCTAFVLSAMAAARHPSATSSTLGISLITTGALSIFASPFEAYQEGKERGDAAGVVMLVSVIAIAIIQIVLGALTLSCKILPKSAGWGNLGIFIAIIAGGCSKVSSTFCSQQYE